MEFIGSWDRKVIALGQSKAWVAFSRLFWIFLLYHLLRTGGIFSISEDFFLLIALQLCSFVILRFPDTLAGPRASRIILLVADFLFMSWGLAAFYRIDGVPPWPLIVFFPALYALLVMAPRLRIFLWSALIAGALLVPVAIWAAGIVSPFRIVSLLAFWAFLVLYLGLTAFPVNATLSLLSRFEKTTERAEDLFRLSVEMADAGTIRELFQTAANSVSKHFPDTRVDALRLAAGEQAELILRPETQGKFPTESPSPNLKECLASGNLTVADDTPPAPRGPESRPAPAKAAGGSVILIPVQMPSNNGKGYVLRVSWASPRIFRDEENAYFRTIHEALRTHFRRIQTESDLTEEKRDLQSKYQPLVKENQDHIALAAILERFATATSLETCMSGLAQSFHGALGADAALFFFLSPAHTLEAVGVFGPNKPELPALFRVSPDRSLVGDCVKNNKVFVHGHLKPPEPTDVHLEDLPALLKAEVKSLITLPLSRAGQVYGCLVLCGRRPGQFRMEAMNLLSRIQAPLGDGIALLKGRDECERELVTGRKRTRLFNGILQAFKAGALQERLGSVFQETFELDWCRFYTVNPASNEWTAVSGDLYFDPADTLHKQCAPDPLMERARINGEGIIVDNTLDDPECPDFSSQQSCRMVVPILHEGEVLGLVDAVAHLERLLTHQDLTLASAAAELIGNFIIFGRFTKGRQENVGKDALTGLPDRNRFIEALEAEAKRCQDARKPYVTAILDVDDLGKINADQGILAGDGIIRAVAEITRAVARPNHFVARCGGNAFAILMPETNMEKAVPIIRQILDWVRTQPFPGGTQVQASAGLAGYPVHGQTASDVFGAAEQSLRRVKQSSKDSFAFPGRELFPVQGKSSRIDTAQLFNDILGPGKKPGPHTVATLNSLIRHLDGKGFDPFVIGDVLYRLILMLDYPERHNEYYNLVPEMVIRLGKELNLTQPRIRDLLLAAKVYDIGKFLLTDDILYANRPLEEDERQSVREHVGAGVKQVLQPHRIFAPILSPVKFHHERWDGSGYPWNLKGDEIPLESQILGIVDVFKALVTERPYKKRMSMAESMEILNGFKNSMFESQLIDAFFKVVESMKVMR
ncbi:MAG: diguanylate cyclase [Acidobacteria bacterium]|nr:diguanylate cyclase [Acidobacteriota bacterium]